MPVSLKGLLKQINAAANAFDAVEVSNVSGELVDKIRENIATHPEGFIKELTEAANTFDRKRVEELCTKLDTHLRSLDKPYPASESKKILGILRRKRYFDLMTMVADVLIQTGQNEPNIRRQYAQALLDLGHISAAMDVLKVLESQCIEKKEVAELAETRGLIGRAHKQVYMDASIYGKPGGMIRQALKQSVSSYLSVYDKAKENIWHGVNTVALLERAKRDRVTLGKSLPQVKTIAKNILKHIESKKEPNMWDFASASEASLALKDYPQALQWILKYTQENPYADAFEYASTLRQFEEVWKLDESHKEQAKILHILKAALLAQEGGRIEIENTSQSLATIAELESDTQFEQILGKDRYKTFIWYSKGMDRASGVAQIINSDGIGLGTGFLVRGSDIHESLGQDWVVVTNAHVISDDPLEQSDNPASLPSDKAEIRFEAKDPNKKFKVDKILFSSPRTELDCTIVSLQSTVEHTKPFPIATHLPLLNKNQRVYVIGHPRGGILSYSIDDNLVLDHEKPKIHYRAPTEGGSSGSPVFNQAWDLLGIHHAGGMNMQKLNKKPGTYPANEGLFFQSIRDAFAEKLAGKPL